MKDIAWFIPDGRQMRDEDWRQKNAKSLGVYLNGQSIPNPNPRGEPVLDDSFFIIFNAHSEALPFALPAAHWAERWIKELDTDAGWLEEQPPLEAGQQIEIAAHSLAVLRNPL
jgi:glycogen operon protein